MAKNAVVAAGFGIAGFALGWATRPLVEARGSALTAAELVSELPRLHDPLFGTATHHTLAHILLFALSCVALGYVMARLTSQ
jgi:ABC-type Fe3+ transport system permease subunit